MQEHAKMIDHRAIARMVLIQDPAETQQTIHSIIQGTNGKEKLMLPVNVDSIIGELGMGMGMGMGSDTLEEEMI
jgi:hypothetical protein